MPRHVCSQTPHTSTAATPNSTDPDPPAPPPAPPPTTPPLAAAAAAAASPPAGKGVAPAGRAAREIGVERETGRRAARTEGDALAVRNHKVHVCVAARPRVGERGEGAGAYLLATARENAQLLTNKLYELLAAAPKKDVIPLPPPTTKLPREKPLPKPRPLTRWERFAKEKGIVKKKRSKMVWDEDHQRWAPRYGYGRANNTKEAPWLIEAKPGDDPSVDPFEVRAEARKERLGKQKRQEERNRLEASHAAGLRPAKGTDGAGKGGKGGKGGGGLRGSERKEYLDGAIAAAQGSTASAGVFDRRLENEPRRGKGKRKAYETATAREHLAHDARRTESVVSKMFPDGAGGDARVKAVSSDKAAKVARLADERVGRKANAEAAGARKAKAERKGPKAKPKAARKGGKA